jgi:DNA-binding FadR family transcriptional regulator
LEKEGRIWRHVGRGTFTGPRPEPDQEELSTVTSVTNPTEIMEARLVLEPKLAAIAALRVTMSELNQMEVFLERSIGALETAEFEYWDGLIHQAIAKATNNSLLISIFSLIHNVRHSEVWGRLKEASLTNDRRKIYSRQHTDIVKALKDRDAIKAENLMKEHLEIIKDHLLKISPIT